LLAVLPAKLVAQKHAARLPKPQAVSQGTWSAPHAVSAGFPPPLLRFSRAYRWPQTAKFPKPRLSCESRARGGKIAILELCEAQSAQVPPEPALELCLAAEGWCDRRGSHGIGWPELGW